VHNCVVWVLQRDAVLLLAVYAVVVCLSACVCWSVCLSHAGIVSKRLNVVSCKQYHMIARDSSILSSKISAKFKRGRKMQVE